MSSSRLRLFGTIHLDRPGKVAGEFSTFAADVDAIFIELPPERPDLRTWGTCLVRTPAFLLSALAFQLFFAPIIVLLTRQYQPIESFAIEHYRNDHDIPVHNVDRPYALVGGARRSIVALNWLVILLAAVLAPIAVTTTVGSILAASGLFHASLRYRDRLAWLCTVPILAWGVLGTGLQVGFLSLPILGALYLTCSMTVAATIPVRDEHMLERIAEITDAEGYEETCLVTGKAHLSGLTALADGFGVTVTRSKPSKWLRQSDAVYEDPDPDDGDWANNVGWSSRSESATGTDADTDTIGRRLLAAILDLAVVGLLLFFVIVVSSVSAAILGVGTIASGLIIGFVGVFLGYFVLLEGLFGQTVGKRLAGVVVVKGDGSSCSLSRATVRHLFRPVDVLLLGIGFVSMKFSSRSRRLGDFVAGTVVVQTTSAGDDCQDSTDSATAKDLSADRPTSQS